MVACAAVLSTSVTLLPGEATHLLSCRWEGECDGESVDSACLTSAMAVQEALELFESAVVNETHPPEPEQVQEAAGGNVGRSR